MIRGGSKAKGSNPGRALGSTEVHGKSRERVDRLHSCYCSRMGSGKPRFEGVVFDVYGDC